MVKKYLPVYDFKMQYYPTDEYTDKNLRHMVAEIIREKALLLLDDEIPHGVQVMVTDYKESVKPILIYADLYCEKENHKKDKTPQTEKIPRKVRMWHRCRVLSQSRTYHNA